MQQCIIWTTKVLSIKDKRQVGVICSAERGQLTTVIYCCNAAGTFVSPFYIFARKRIQEGPLDNAPLDSQATVTHNSCIHLKRVSKPQQDKEETMP